MEGGLMKFFGKGTTNRMVEEPEEKRDKLVKVQQSLQAKNLSYEIMRWALRSNTEDRINRKPEDQKNDHRTENTRNHKTKKMNLTEPNISSKWSYKITLKYLEYLSVLGLRALFRLIIHLLPMVCRY